MLPPEPAHADELAVIVAEGIGVIATLAAPAELHPAAVRTVTPSVTVPLAAAWNAIDRVPAPDVIVPFVIVHV